jgi:hypothetical protein
VWSAKVYKDDAAEWKATMIEFLQAMAEAKAEAIKLGL